MSRQLLNISKDGDSPMLVVGHPHREKRFPDFHMEHPVFQFVPIASGPVTGHH